ncbi:hypothetical protein [Sphingobacterium sp. IITKGP-BTPF85]|uniref:hypothetical protein n=1 Tax=Sphingobacterium sp. IITKGP-BTPF85 TaxID=1338009 RepID=UPI00038A52F9|nr:hypothetical protein [Sphingobacterium sp. IITKGP-BTPF85]KKX50355.1 hypothetical protein L950_0211010 [Sphingobacterium sp. IITKGP-BTPF85]
MKKLKQLYFTNRFFYGLLTIATFFVISFFVKVLFIPVAILFWILTAVMIWDLIFLFSGKGNVSVIRNYPEIF